MKSVLNSCQYKSVCENTFEMYTQYSSPALFEGITLLGKLFHFCLSFCLVHRTYQKVHLDPNCASGTALL